MNKYDTCCPNDTAYPVGDDMVIGLTKRELFAAMAMQGILSNSSIFDNMQEMGEKDPTITVALAAIEHADALINALNAE